MNPLTDALAAPLAARDRPLLFLPGDATANGKDLHALSGRAANALASYDVSPGDRVLVQTEKSPLALALYLACLRAGAVFLPLNTAYTTAEMEYFIRDSEPGLVVCDPEAEGRLRPTAVAHGVPLRCLDADGAGSLSERIHASGTRFETIARSEEDLAVILYTSGTTGRPKGAMLTQRNLLSNADALVEAWRFSADDVLLHALPIFHAHGLFVATNVTLRAGAAMIFLPKFEPDQVIAQLPQATAMMGVPTYFTRLLREPRFDRKLSAHMRVFISGSAPLLAETHRAFETRTGHRILERYGMTETSMNTSNPYDGERRAGTVGFPLPGVEARISDPGTGAAVPTGETGMLEIRGPNVFKGYWRMPEKTNKEFRQDGFFITGDLARIDPDGYIVLVGRARDLVISGGYNVYPKEVESEIDAIDGVLESAVIGSPHPDFGEGVVAVVVRSPGSVVSEKEVIAALADRLARYKQPKRVLFAKELLRNTMGKVQKNLLRDRHKDIFTRSS